jgi:hypothetical protein
MVQLIQVGGVMSKERGLETRYGLMVQGTRDTGKVTRQTVKGSLSTQMETSTMEIGLTIKLMERETTRMLQERIIAGIG